MKVTVATGESEDNGETVLVDVGIRKGVCVVVSVGTGERESRLRGLWVYWFFNKVPVDEYAGEICVEVTAAI